MKSAAARPTRPLQINQKMSLGKAGAVLAAMILISRLTGFGRLIVTSVLFGRGPDTDAYNAAFNIPDTLAILISGGLLATGFVPVFTRLLTEGNSDGARRTFRALLTLMLTGFGGISLVLWALTFTPAGTLLAPDKVAPQYVQLYLYILRILLVAQFLFVVGGVFAGTFNAMRLFWLTALQPVFYNCGIIIFGLLGAKMGMGIESQAWGALFGAFCGTILMLTPAAWHHGLSLKPLWDWRDEGVQRVLGSLGPIFLGLASGQIIALNLPRAFAKALEPGAITSLDVANRLMQVPLDLLASSAAVALLPTISRLWVEGEVAEMRATFGKALARNIALMLFATAMLFALAPFLVRLVLEHGKFSAADGDATSLVLRCYALCLPALGVQQLLARAYYATERGKDVVPIGLIAMALFFVFGFLAVRLPFSFPHDAGLALAAAISTSILSLGLARGLGRDWRELDAIAVKTARFGLAIAVVAGLAAYGASAGLEHLLAAHNTDLTPKLVKLLVRTIIFGAGAVVGVGLWSVLARKMGIGLKRL